MKLRCRGIPDENVTACRFACFRVILPGYSDTLARYETVFIWGCGLTFWGGASVGMEHLTSPHI